MGNVLGIILMFVTLVSTILCVVYDYKNLEL